jgi:hypothetical protein
VADAPGEALDTPGAVEDPQELLEARLNRLANALFVAAGLVAFLSVVLAAALAGGQGTLADFGFEALERQSRDVAAIGALMGGVLGGGVLAGVAGVLKLLLSRSAAERAAASDRVAGQSPSDAASD